MLGPVGWLALVLSEQGCLESHFWLDVCVCVCVNPRPLDVGQRGPCRTTALDAGWRGISVGHVPFQRERGLLESASVHRLCTLWETDSVVGS